MAGEDGERVVTVSSAYGYAQRRHLKSRLAQVQNILSRDLSKPLSVRRYHGILADVLIAVDHVIRVDDGPPLTGAYVTPVSRPTFAHLLSMPINPDLMSVHHDTWVFVQCGLDLLAGREEFAQETK